MRPATRPAIRNILFMIVSALAFVMLARVMAGRALRDRCIVAAESMPLAAGGSVGAALEKSAPGGSWSVGAREKDGPRVVFYEEWKWSCLDEEMRPSFIALSPKARELTPERWFP